MRVSNHKEDEEMGASKLTGQAGLRMCALLVSLWLAGAGAQGAWAQVTYERLLKAAQEPHNWLTYSGDYSGRRYNLLKQIHTGNVEHLAVQWVFQTGATGKFQATPLVIDGIMYLTGQGNRAYAAGCPHWTPPVALSAHPAGQTPPLLRRGQPRPGGAGRQGVPGHAGRARRGAGRETGNVVWDVEAEDYRKGHIFTSAPLVVKDKVVVGVVRGRVWDSRLH